MEYYKQYSPQDIYNYTMMEDLSNLKLALKHGNDIYIYIYN